MTHALPRDLSCPRIATRKGGLELSRIVAGMWRMVDWNMTVEQRVAFIEQCIAMGVTSFDHADIYGNYGVQVEFSPLHVAPMFDETFDGLQDLGVAPMIWSPLAGGRLFTSNDANAENLRLVIKDIADRLQKPFASVVFAWIMQLPSNPIPLT